MVAGMIRDALGAFALFLTLTATFYIIHGFGV